MRIDDRRLHALPDFPFSRLRALLDAQPGPDGRRSIDMSIGEPQHAPPDLLAQTVAANAHLWNRYPSAAGTPDYRQAVVDWLTQRYALAADALQPERHIAPVVGTKEALFLLPQSLMPQTDGDARPVMMIPNPVYATYGAAAVFANAELRLLDAEEEKSFLPDLDALHARDLERCVFLYLCSPSNPQGTIADSAYLERAIGLARRHDFVLVVDECYSEIYDRDPPPGALSVALDAFGDLANTVVMHSLSKRSSAAGLRSGFVAGDPEVIGRFVRFRAYGAPVQPLPLMAAATALWRDEEHVEASRRRYRAKIDVAERRLGNRFGFYRPPGGFFLWLDVGDGEEVARRLWREAALRVLPGAYLSVPGADGRTPADRFIRLALVHEETVVDEAMSRIVETLS